MTVAWTCSSFWDLFNGSFLTKEHLNNKSKKTAKQNKKVYKPHTGMYKKKGMRFDLLLQKLEIAFQN